jgi:hypothetical protein
MRQPCFSSLGRGIAAFCCELLWSLWITPAHIFYLTDFNAFFAKTKRSSSIEINTVTRRRSPATINSLDHFAPLWAINAPARSFPPESRHHWIPGTAAGRVPANSWVTAIAGGSKWQMPSGQTALH